MGRIKLGADQIYIGGDALEVLSGLQGKKAFIVESGTFNRQAGFEKMVADRLEQAGIEWEAFTEVEPEPCFDTIVKGARRLREFQPEWIIGFGGGSAMDAAKVMWAFYENGADSYEEFRQNEGIRCLGEKARLICIPTSSGTGSEVTKAAVIKDSKTHVKYPIADMQWRLVPDIAILYPPFTCTMPADFTAACGMDAVTHAVEAWVSRSANAFSNAMAAGAFRLAAGSILTACASPEDGAAREAMLEASCMAGIAFTNSSLGIAHAVSHAYGGFTGLPHGLINAVILPYVIRYNSGQEQTKAKYQELAQMAGAENLEDFIKDLNLQMAIPRFLAAIPGTPAVSAEEWDEITEAALADVNLKGNPRETGRAEMKELILQMYQGE